MSYSPIVVPAIAYAVWSALLWLSCTLPALVLYLDDDPDDPILTEKETRWVTWYVESRQYYLMAQPVPFYAICLILAFIGADSGWAVGAAWAFALVLPLRNARIGTLRRAGGAISFICGSALCLYAAFRVASDFSS